MSLQGTSDESHKKRDPPIFRDISEEQHPHLLFRAYRFIDQDFLRSLFG